MKRTKLLLTMVLFLILCMMGMTSVAAAVYAAGDGEEEGEVAAEEADPAVDFNKNPDNTGFGTAGMSAPKRPAKTMSSWQGSYVYYGKDKWGKKLKYRVLDTDSADFHTSAHTMLLDCDEVVFRSKFDDASNEWNFSALRTSLNNGGELQFTALEDEAIILSSKAAAADGDGNGVEGGVFVPLSNEKIFALDAREATRSSYGYTSDSGDCVSRMKTDGVYGPDGAGWWLRSSCGHSSGGNATAALVFKGGIFPTLVFYENAGGYSSYGASPAFNLDLSSILFSTAIEGGYGKLGSAYKLTLLDENMTAGLSEGSKLSFEGSTVTVPYSLGGSNAAAANVLSILILDKGYKEGNADNAKILYYGKLDIQGSVSESTSGSFTLPADLDPDQWGSAYKVYLLAEQVNDNKETDYASVPAELVYEADGLWVGGVRVTEKNQKDILGDGKAAFDPKTNTLSFKDAKITEGYEYSAGHKAGIFSRNIALNIKGTVTIENPELYSGIHCSDPDVTEQPLVLDGNITIHVGRFGIGTRNKGLKIDGGVTEITSDGMVLSIGGDVILGEGVEILSPVGAIFEKSSSGLTTLVGEDASRVTEALIGIDTRPDPLKGGHSPLDPVPELKPGVTTDLYLVKGQKFNIGQGWYVDKEDKESRRKVSISKNGSFKAKAEGDAVIRCGSGAISCEVKIHISRPALEKKSLKLKLEGPTEVKKEQIVLDYDAAHLDVLWYSANPDVVTVDENGMVTTVGKGSSKVTAYINGSAYTCTVSVSEKEPLRERTLHIAKGASTNINIKGLSKPLWEESVADIVSVEGKRITGRNPGTTELSCTKDGILYKLTVIVEDIGMSGSGLKAQGKPASNKYLIDELKTGDTTVLSFAGVDRDVVFKSSKPEVAFIDEHLNVVMRKKGKAKFTAKLNGKTITISVNVKE